MERTCCENTRGASESSGPKAVGPYCPLFPASAAVAAFAGAGAGPAALASAGAAFATGAAAFFTGGFAGGAAFVGSLLPLRQLLDEHDGVASTVESGA